MGKIIRILIAVIVILSFVLLARSGAAWAANPGADSASLQSAVQPGKSKPCFDEHGKKRDCEDDDNEADDEDDEDGDDDDDDGTVKPPSHRIKVCKLGTFSVGGVATIQIKQLRRGDCVIAFTVPYDPDDDPPLPPNTSVLTDILELKLPKKNALVKLCFAAPPGKKVGIYTFSHGEWKSVSTGVKNGVICTETAKSGSFILLRRK